MRFYILLLTSLICLVTSEFCGLPNGSPISIPTNKALPLDDTDELILSKFCRPLSGTFENDGENLVFLPNITANEEGCTPVIPFMTGGPFEDDTFEFNRMVLFWGNVTEDFEGNSELGSEHSLDGQKADAELQMVFTKTTYEKDLDAALAAEYGVAILSMMINGDNDSDEENWFTLFETAANETYNATSNNQMPVTSLILGDIVDSLTTSVASNFDYYFYVGSYNFAPCNPNVFWVVAESIASATFEQLSYLTNMTDVNGLNITSNYREQQGYDCRKILTSLDN